MCVCAWLLLTDLTRSDVAYIECLETCWLQEHRHCAEVPDKCGECLSSYASDDNGVCQPVNRQRTSARLMLVLRLVNLLQASYRSGKTGKKLGNLSGHGKVRGKYFF